MDTPEKKTQPSPSLLSKFQDSPVFNYISSLSPIKPFNLGHSWRSFPLFTFASPQSLQTSPPISCPKESNITSAISVSDAPKNNCSQSGNEDEIASVSATEEALKMFIELPRSLKYECGSPQKSAVHCNVTKITPLKVIQDICKEVDHSSETDMGLQGIRLEKKKDVCDLEKFVYEASDILNYCSPTKEKHQEELDDTSVDSGTLSFVATVLQVPNEIVDGTWKMGSTPNYETSLLPAINARAILAEEVVQFSSTEVDDKTFSEQQQTKKHMIARRPGSNKFSSLLPGIGLHLNALAATSRDKIIVKRQTLTCRRQLISSPCTVSSFDSLTSDTKPLNIQIAPGLAGNDGYEQKDGVQVTANACQSSTSGVDIQFHQSSPKKKRQRSEIAGEIDSCKHCNCKRSKCLKLYCECFAAGLYCIGSCSCQDCFNKPIHEETVLETRRQIEARNPLAFAPKVIRGLSLHNGS